MQKIRRLEGNEGQLERIIIDNEEAIVCKTLFFNNGYDQQSELAKKFNCKLTRRGIVYTDRFQQTNIPGLYVAGDASKDMQLVIIAVAEGARAAVAINMALQAEDRK